MNTEYSLRRDQDEAEAIKAYLNPLPRSVVRNGVFTLLDGEWHFELDPEDCGLHERWYLGHDFKRRAQWPGTIESQMLEAHARRPHSEVIAWYEREFEIPEDWLKKDQSLVQLTFGACGYETRVWLNGKPLKTVEGEEVHFGEYTSFSYELPREDLKAVNRLTVRIADSLDPETPRGKQESHVYKRGGIWYQATSGPVRSVWLEPVERNRLRSRLSVVSQVKEGLLELRLTTRVHDAGCYGLRVVVYPRGTREPVAIKDVNLRLDAGEKHQYLTLELPKAKAWSPASPRLYQVVAQLLCPGGHVSQIETHVGLREFEARGKWLYLNGERIYLDGILYQPATSTFDEMRRHVYGVKELGCNLLRVHIAGIDPRVYELADELGMLVWVEVPSPHQSTPRSRKKHWAELQRMLRHVASHPSVVLLSLYNEDWGAEDIATNPETRAYIAQCYAYLRLNYPQFLVVDNDGWRHVSSEGRLESHLLTAHLYQTDLERWREVLDKLVVGEHDDIAAHPLVIGDPFFYNGQVPLLVSEWGGFGFSMYGGPNDLKSRAQRIREFKQELRSRAIAGDVYTQATNVEEEDNGLLDTTTGERLVPAGLLGSDSSTDTK
jgi:beta-galactosidase/beta-glucuronidase